MRENYLKIHIERLFNEFQFIKGNLYIINSFMTERSKSLSAIFPIPEYDLIGTAGTFRDVTITTPGQINLFPTGYGYSVNTSDLTNKIQRSISFACCLSIAQAYEAVEEFIKDILSITYLSTDRKVEFKFEDIYITAAEVKSNFWRIKNNRGYIKVLRRLSDFFKQHEKDNTWKINMSDCYDIIFTC